MPRWAAKADANQGEIVAELRARGVTVLYLHRVGMGCPDIACGYKSRNFFFEIKDGNKPPSARRLTDMESLWHVEWNGQVDVIHSAEEALAIMQEDTARDYNAQVEEWSGGGV
ncbi:hypothetical protein ROJ8625_04112 [Roseivivax jejudonensis]|uniref:VRR-NUC domain protein n=1 Tax=Roseivivax jejudonensis TaxID=1529041 RepID=A0A1X7ABS1_9RHOB|nr:hypothetical protein [Roseivivax jejudonensis]SLN74848.1 hypothetical protein ROJ8625_04112 [Roseivivax jejudonensis]